MSEPAVDAARYLLRLGRPRASNAEVERAVPSVLADPTYRDELAQTVANGLLFQLRTAMAILDGHDAATDDVERCACGFPERHTNLPCSR